MVVIDQLLVDERFQGRIDTAGRFEPTSAHKAAAVNLGDRALPSQAPHQAQLIVGQRGDNVLIDATALLDEGQHSQVDLSRLGHSRLGVIEFVKHRLDIPGVSLETVVYVIECSRRQCVASTLKKLLCKAGIGLFAYRFQIEDGGALEKWPTCREKHLAHQVAAASRKDEVDIVQKLDVRPQHGFGILVLIFGNLLKLVDGNEALLPGLFHVVKQLFERVLRLVGFDGHSELW